MVPISEQSKIAIQKYFGFLFENGFSFKECEEAEGGAHCFVCLRSEKFTIKFEIDLNVPVMIFGDLNAACNWETYHEDEANGWFNGNANLILKFLYQKYSASNLPGEPSSLDSRLERLAKRIEPYFVEISSAFPREENKKWWDELADFEAKELEKIRSQILKKQ